MNGPGVEERGVGMYRFLKKIPPHPAYRGRYLVKEHNPVGLTDFVIRIGDVTVSSIASIERPTHAITS